MPIKPNDPFAYSAPTTIAQACEPSAAELERRARSAAQAATARAATTRVPDASAARRRVTAPANRAVSLPPPTTVPLSPAAQRLLTDISSAQSQAPIRTPEQLRARLLQMSPADIEAAGRAARARGWVSLVTLTRGLWAVNQFRNQCSAAQGNPSDPATARRMFPLILASPAGVSLSNEILRRARPR